MTEQAPETHCEECGTTLYQAGERVPGGAYLRVDDGSFHRVSLPAGGTLPASFDGHVALYRSAAARCACQQRVCRGTSDQTSDQTKGEAR